MIYYYLKSPTFLFLTSSITIYLFYKEIIFVEVLVGCFLSTISIKLVESIPNVIVKVIMNTGTFTM